jgi:hypothetical protein
MHGLSETKGSARDPGDDNMNAFGTYAIRSPRNPFEKGRMKIKAIVIGNVVDVVGTMAASILLGIIGMIIQRLTSEGEALSYLAGHLIPSGKESRPFLMAVGITFSIFGGYISARIAKERELLYGGLSTLLCLALGVVAMINAHEIGIKSIFSKILTISLGVLGGYLYLRRKTGSGIAEQGVAA